MPSKYPVLECALGLGLLLLGSQARAEEPRAGSYVNGEGSCTLEYVMRPDASSPTKYMRCRTEEKDGTTKGNHIIVEREGIETRVDGKPMLALTEVSFVDPASGLTTDRIYVFPRSRYDALKKRIEAGEIRAIPQEGGEGKMHLGAFARTVKDTVKLPYLASR